MEPVFAPARDAESPRIIDLSDNLKRAAAGSPGVERKILLQCDDTAEAALLAAELEAIEAERRASFHDYSSLLAEGTVREGEWYSDGLVRGPRLRGRDATTLPMAELFNSVAFANAFSVSKVAYYLVVERDVVQYLLYFSAFWTAWTLSAEYAARYNDTDLVHKAFWAAYGACVVGMLMHTGGGVRGPNAGWFCGCNAAIALLVCAMHARVFASFVHRRLRAAATGDAAARREATTVARSAAFHGAVYVAMAAAWATAARSERARVAAWTLAVLLEPVGEVAYAWAAGGDGLVPVSERYLVHKFESILVMQLSVNIITAAAAVDPSKFPARQRTTLRVAALSSYAHFVNFKLLGVDVDSGARLRDPFLFRQSPSRILYRLQQPVLICFINAAAAGMARLVARPVAKVPDADLLFARRVACVASAAFYVGLLVQRALQEKHDAPWSLESLASLKAGVRRGQAVVTGLVAGCTAFLPDLIVLGCSGRDLRAYKAARTISWLAGLSSVLVATHLADIALEARHVAKHKRRVEQLDRRQSSLTASSSSVGTPPGLG